jgi:hypothetical protein
LGEIWSPCTVATFPKTFLVTLAETHQQKGALGGGMFETVLPDDIFEQKIQIWVNFGRSRNERCWYLTGPNVIFLLPSGTICGHWVHFVVIWYIFPPFWYYVVPRKIWQPWFKRLVIFFVCQTIDTFNQQFKFSPPLTLSRERSRTWAKNATTRNNNAG